MTKNDTFDHESIQDIKSIAKYLNALIEGFEKNKLVFQSEETMLEMFPHDLLQFRIKAQKKLGKNKINIKVTWRDTKFHGKDGKMEIIT